MTLDRALEDRLAAAGSQADTRPAEALGEDTARSIVRAAAVAVGTLVENGYPPVILTAPAARALLKDLTRADLPRLVVLGQREIPRDTPVEVLGSVVEEEPEAVTTYTHGSSRVLAFSVFGDQVVSNCPRKPEAEPKDRE